MWTGLVRRCHLPVLRGRKQREELYPEETMLGLLMWDDLPQQPIRANEYYPWDTEAERDACREWFEQHFGPTNIAYTLPEENLEEDD